MRKKQLSMLRPGDPWSSCDRTMAGAMIGIAVAIAAAAAPAGAQTLPSKLQGPTKAEDAPASAKQGGAAALRRERFRRMAAEAAQKQLEILADQLRQQLAREITARQAAEVVAAELLSRAKLEEQIDSERQRLKAAAETATPQRAGVSGDASQLKALIKDLERKLKTAEWARKLAEAQLKIMTGNRGR